MTTDRLPVEIEDYLAHLAVERGRAPNTVEAYRRDLLRYTRWLGPRSVRDVGSADIRSYRKVLDDSGLATSSLARAMTSVRGLHRWLVAEGVRSEDPTADVETDRVPKRLPKALREDEINALLEATRGSTPAERRDLAIIETLYGTGMRISECVQLSIDDLDLDASLMRITGKGNKQRLVPIGRCAEESLRAWFAVEGRSAFSPERWRSRDDERAVFLNRRGGRLSRQGMWGVVRKHGRAVGLGAKLSPHVLRHSCATHMLDHGADIRTVQELLGHASVSTTQIYTGVSQDLLLRTYRSAHPRATRSETS